jgi:hypothetical protein
MTQDNTVDLFKYLNADPSFIMNLLGRPDYWAPQTRWTSDSNSNILACGLLHQTVAFDNSKLADIRRFLLSAPSLELALSRSAPLSICTL